MEGRNRASEGAGAGPRRGENVAVDASFLRICAVPMLSPPSIDGLALALESFGVFVPIARADADLNASVVELRAPSSELDAAVRAAASALKESARTSLLRFELQTSAPDDGSNDSALAVVLSEELESAVYCARRTVPASQWVEQQPIGFGVDGFAIRAQSPAVAPSSSRGRGASLEFGAPTMLMKVSLHGVPPSVLRRMCDAVGTSRGGLLHLGANPAISVATGEPLLVIECSDAVKSPPARGIALLSIEAARYGGAVGAATLLSHIPLDALRGALAENMQLAVEPAQIIETHVAAS